MSSPNKKNGASAVVAIPDAQLTKDRDHVISPKPAEETYVKKHPLNVNPTFNNKRWPLL